MHYNLLFNGCSFTAGGELDGPNNDLEHQRIHRFSHLVAEHFGMTYENISRHGVSNDWIVEKTIEWFEEGNTCDVAIIQFTDKSRTIWYDQNNNIEHMFAPHKIKKFTKNYTYHNINRIYYKLFYSEILGTQNYYKNLFFITNYLKNKNIKYILLSLDCININEKNYYGWGRYCKSEQITRFSDLIGEKKNHNQNTCINENYCPDFSQKDAKYIFLTGTHPSEIGHQKIAQYIIDTIGTLQ